MGRKRNPSDLLLYAAVGIGTLLLGKILFGAPRGAQAALPPDSGVPETPNATQPPVEVSSGISLAPQAPLALSINWPSERVLVLGDSLFVGAEPPLKRAMQALGVAAFSGISVGGTNIMQWSDNRYAEGRAMEAALRDFRPTLVLVGLGTNDEMTRGYKDWRGRDWAPDKLAKNQVGPNFSVAKQRASDIARLARKLSGVKSVWVGPPASPERKWPMERALRDSLASTWSGRYFNTEAVAPPKAPDGIHFTGSGYQKWADSIMAYLSGR